MSINRRTAFAVRSIGVASAAAALALGVAGSAFACSIGDFAATPVCDQATGKTTISITDKDGSGTPATVTILDNGAQVGSGSIDHPTAEGVTISIDVAWKPSTTYTVHVTAGQPNKKPIVDQDIKGGVTTPAEACTAPTPSSTPTTPSSTPTTPETSPTTAAPSPSTTSPAAAVDDTNAPSPAGGTSDLAETGGGSNTGMIAGVAAVLLAAGGGTVFMLRRRNPAGRH
ncbi:LAETG motif-containing sortase-dependent surface protein [Streptomyces sp. NBC_01198]|uniref:LAETG motif-containing sortase-dependent surface protein n=1 Tax=Streptomyces sp. NBC_01198 TaxID=2903769 RepID=UPI002E0F2E65|nr:LPXTG cell wall anchor domain-containing protein [Streptomyces sp. NBC_01198]